jgi:PAS domain S-box-containing protein
MVPSVEFSSDHYRRLVENSLGLICAHDLDGHLLFVNLAAARSLGYSPEDGVGRSLREFLAPTSRPLFDAYLARIRQRKIDEGLMRVVDRDGRERVWMYRNVCIDEAGDRPYVVGHALDITERIALERSLRQGEQEIRVAFEELHRRLDETTDSLVAVNSRARAELVTNQRAIPGTGEPFQVDDAPVMVWMSDPGGQCLFFNRRWLEFTGRSPGTPVSVDWDGLVHAEDRDRRLDTYNQARIRREPFRIEHRLRRYDGEFRWVLDVAAPRIGPDGRFDGYIGSCIDITQHKAFQDVLGKLSRRLMDAQEQERAWIARELRDDFAQRAVALALQLHGFAHLVEPGTREHDRVQQFGAQASDLAKDMGALSRRLSSSTLELLGLKPAVVSFCREVSAQQNVKIECRVEKSFRDPPPEIALGLFRVLQEAVTNAVQHSGEREIHVALRQTASEIELEVSDHGTGFDPEAAIRAKGLGLIGMRERLKLIGGAITFDSEAGAGTRVLIHVPA